MAEASRFWTTGSTGDGASAYTQAQVNEFFRSIFNSDNFATEGVLATYLNELAVSGTATPIVLATGAAFVYGFWYTNDASKNITISTPVVGTTGHRLVLRADWTAQTVRVVDKSSADGTAAIPALTQTINTTYEISLATFTVTTGGIIAVTDARSYCHFATKVDKNNVDNVGIGAVVFGASNGGLGQDITNLIYDDSNNRLGIGTASPSNTLHVKNGSDAQINIENTESGTGYWSLGAGFGAGNTDFSLYNQNTGAQRLTVDKDGTKALLTSAPLIPLYSRQGGSATVWSTAGTSTQTVGDVRSQVGVGTLSFSASATSANLTVTFPTAFAQAPTVQLTCVVSNFTAPIVVNIVSVSASQVVITGFAPSGSFTGTALVHWEAKGPIS